MLNAYTGNKQTQVGALLRAPNRVPTKEVVVQVFTTAGYPNAVSSVINNNDGTYSVKTRLKAIDVYVSAVIADKLSAGKVEVSSFRGSLILTFKCQ